MLWLTTEEKAVDAFKEYLEEYGLAVYAPHYRTVGTIEEAAELDYVALNEEWSNWIDDMMTRGEAPDEATGWDWENVVGV